MSSNKESTTALFSIGIAVALAFAVLPVSVFIGLMPFMFNDTGGDLPFWAYLFPLIPIVVFSSILFIIIRAVKLFVKSKKQS